MSTKLPETEGCGNWLIAPAYTVSVTRRQNYPKQKGVATRKGLKNKKKKGLSTKLPEIEGCGNQKTFIGRELIHLLSTKLPAIEGCGSVDAHTRHLYLVVISPNPMKRGLRPANGDGV
ncbi:MAG: hypothetical protein N3F63_07975 [Thermoplasmata archaeon]|nr:hypothetical protein [Thermoplasmata archaeon]